MTQHAQTIVNDEGSVLFEIIGDTATRGASISAAGIWHSSTLIEQYITALTTMKIWLEQEGQ